MARIEFEQLEVSWDPTWIEGQATAHEDDETDGVVLSVACDSQEQESEEDRVMYPDRRMLVLDEGLRALIYARFGGDMDEAMLHADRICHTYARPPMWAVALHDVHMRELRRCGGSQ